MSEEVFVRSSRMPLAMKCPPSILPAKYQLNADDDPARLGTAVHEWLSMKLQGQGGVSDEVFELLAVKYTLPMDEIRILSLRAWELWQTVSKYFPQPQVELEVNSAALHPLIQKGHIDVLYYSEQTRTIFILDHKTGWLDADATHQIKSYAYQALETFPGADRVRTLLARVREFTTDGDTYSKEELVAWGDYARRRITQGSNDYNPGRHCTYCSHRLNCMAYQDWISKSIQLLLGLDVDKPITPDMIGKVYDAKQSIDKLSDSVQELLKTMAGANNGSLDCGDGVYELRLEDEARTEILYSNSHTILKQELDLSPDEWDEIIRIKKTALSQHVMDNAARGQKKKVWTALLERLEQAQATRETTQRKLVHRKKSLPVIK